MKHNHYFKPVAGLQHIDVYRVLQLFGVTDPCLQHAIKKLLVAGGRGAKDISQDVQEATDTLLRWQEMRREEEARGFYLAAELTLQNLGYTFHGGQLWKPPLGRMPTAMLDPSGADFDEQRADIIGQNGNTGEHYAPEPHWASGQIPSAQDREPERPRHLCQTCAQGHATHECTAGQEAIPLGELAIQAGSKPVDEEGWKDRKGFILNSIKRYDVKFSDGYVAYGCDQKYAASTNWVKIREARA